MCIFFKEWYKGFYVICAFKHPPEILGCIFLRMSVQKKKGRLPLATVVITMTTSPTKATWEQRSLFWLTVWVCGPSRQSIMAETAWQHECEEAIHVESAVRKPRGKCRLSAPFLLCIQSDAPACGLVPPAFRLCLAVQLLRKRSELCLLGDSKSRQADGEDDLLNWRSVENCLANGNTPS